MTDSSQQGATTTNAPDLRVPGIALVGLNGFGRQHLLNIHRLVALGKANFVAGAGPDDPGPDIRGEDTPIFASLDALIDAGISPDIIIVSTPINTHHELALKALVTGADLYLEKPPTATFAQYQELLSAAREAGARVQVGFQAVGSLALEALEEFFVDDARDSPIGELRAVGASGTWLRTQGYYDRAPWAGHRVLDGIHIADGVITNPLAHAVMSALHIAGARRAEDVAELSTELYRAHDIEADDTSVLCLRTVKGIPVTAALTVCAAEQRDPWVTVYGTEGQATLYYTRDELVVRPNPDLGGKEYIRSFGRVNLLENLVDVRSGAAPKLLCPVENAGAFMKVLEQVRTSPDPQAICRSDVYDVGEDGEYHPVVPDIEKFIDRAVAAQTAFSSLGAPWAKPAPTSGTLQIAHPISGDPVEVARLRTGTDIAPTNSPRPFLDQLRTLDGVTVSDQQPLDHTWHLGLGVALQDVNGTNFWGGRTYTRSAGRYLWKADHGHIRAVCEEFNESNSAVTSHLEWVDHHGQVLLDEHRTVRAEAFERLQIRGWSLDFEFALQARDQQVSLGSPGSNGRDQGGYGGFFWRLPAVHRGEIYTANASGESAVHGSTSDWLAFSAVFSADSVGLDSRDLGHGAATLIFCSTAHDPWFVRYSGYPGIGASLAWDSPVILEPSALASRKVRILVVDGALSKQQSAQLAEMFNQE
ncbi:DUF6807 family protein [Glutamicibacter sp. 287]|uniref:DUF6807 family protein n=1 Tax=unclassified Glutamicibacter TaxID=2627139 RepID=UPI000BB9651A|nr:DUF6807 family protein [Glutamicibacter sp. BW80]PCC30616.1 oxidoreductase [Glutamicibacter sp. BW80]